MNDIFSGDQIEMRPPAVVVAVAIAAITTSIGMTLWSLTRIDRFTVIGFVVMPIAILLAFVLGVDAIQRRYVFSKDKIEVRYLFLWKQYKIYGEVEVSANKSGQVRIRDSQNPAPLLHIPREYNRENLLEEKLRIFFDDSA